jgi:pyruvate-formate lyase
MSEDRHKPPQAVADAAAKGLELRREFKRGGTEVGVARARDLKARKNLSADTIKRMASYFARHKVDKRAANFGNDEDPSAGYVAWLLWGGEEGRKWAAAQKDKLEKG